MDTQYWCHFCLQMVHPILDTEIKCPVCQSGFVEEMSNATNETQEPDIDLSSDRAVSLWAPILLGMMGNTRRRRRSRRMAFDEEEDDDEENDGESELEHEFELFMRRRRRSSATILQLLQRVRAGMASETENSEGERTEDGVRDREQERVILINPLNRTIIVQGRNSQNPNHIPIGSLGDYFVGPGLDMLMQHLAENDPNRYGTPPTQKEAIEALPTVKVGENVQCSVCLDEFEMRSEAKEMPCKHKFHSGCILPWLELHSSCPVCRFQLPAEESKTDSGRRESDHENNDNDNDQNHSSNDDMIVNTNGGSVNNEGNGGIEMEIGEEGEGRSGNGNGRRFTFPWLFNNIFPSSSSGSRSGSQADET